VWQWNKSAIISSLQGVLVLDSLNTSLLYTTTGTGYMKPLVAASDNKTVVSAFTKQANHHLSSGGRRLKHPVRVARIRQRLTYREDHLRSRSE
jgi:hypothetical protein